MKLPDAPLIENAKSLLSTLSIWPVKVQFWPTIKLGLLIVTVTFFLLTVKIFVSVEPLWVSLPLNVATTV